MGVALIGLFQTTEGEGAEGEGAGGGREGRIQTLRGKGGGEVAVTTNDSVVFYSLGSVGSA